jgi:hypothetical protein
MDGSETHPKPRRTKTEWRLIAMLQATRNLAGHEPRAMVYFRVASSARPEGKVHRVGPDFGSTLTVFNRDSQSNCWVDWKITGQPCEFQVRRASGSPGR